MQSHYPSRQLEVVHLVYSKKLSPAFYLPLMVLIDKVFLSSDIEKVVHRSEQ